MVRWVSKAQKTNNGIGPELGKHLTSKLSSHPSHVPSSCFEGVIFLQKACNGLLDHAFSENGYTPASNLHSPSEYENTQLNLDNYVSGHDLYALLSWLLPLPPSYLLWLATGRYVVLGASLVYCQWLSSHGSHSSDICMPDASCHYLKCAQIISAGVMIS